MTKVKKDLEYVEVVETTPEGDAEELDTLVRLPFHQLLGASLPTLIQNLTVLAVGNDDEGQFKLESIVVTLAGTVQEDIVFRVQGKLLKFKSVTKKLPKVVKSKKVKRGKKKT